MDNRKGTGRISVSLYLNQQQIDAIERIAAHMDKSKADILRDAVDRAIIWWEDNFEKEKKFLEELKQEAKK